MHLTAPLMLQLLERGGLGDSGTVELLCLDCLVCVSIQNEHPNALNNQIHMAMQPRVFHRLLQSPVAASAFAGVLMAVFDFFSVTLIFCLSWSCW